eukprot:426412-Rhodomonas_salina.4
MATRISSSLTSFDWYHHTLPQYRTSRSMRVRRQIASRDLLREHWRYGLQMLVPPDASSVPDFPYHARPPYASSVPGQRSGTWKIVSACCLRSAECDLLATVSCRTTIPQVSTGLRVGW